MASDHLDSIHSQNFTETDSDEETKIRRAAHIPKKKEKLTANRIEKDYTLLSADEKLAKSAQIISDLNEQNKDYFRGKQMLFNNDSSYFQSVLNPVEKGQYIVVQTVRKQNSVTVMSDEKDTTKVYQEINTRLIP